MKTLYDLLAVSPDADVKALKIAFRKAVKANHPDLHREDPHVPSKFRQIVAANTILSDAVQRAAYDQLLKLERQRCRLQWRRLIISAAIVFTVALVWARWINTLSSQTILTAINSKRGAARTEIGVGDVGSQTVGNSLYEGRNGSAEVPEMVRQITSTAAPDNAGLASDLETMVAIAGTNYDRPQPIVDARTVINLPLPPVGPVPAMKPQTVPTPIAPAVTQGLASLPPLITPSGAQNSLDTAKSQPRRLAPTEIALMVKNGTDYMANGNIGAARLMFQHAAEAGDSAAAFALAETYDPSVLPISGVRGGITSDIAMAISWYEKAKDLGSTLAPGRLKNFAGLAE